MKTLRNKILDYQILKGIIMSSTTHLKVLLRKDFLTLWRNKGFLIAFVLLPIILIGGFSGLIFGVSKGYKEGSLLRDNFKYTTTLQSPLNMSFFDIPAIEGQGESTIIHVSNLAQCGRLTRRSPYTKIGIVVEQSQDDPEATKKESLRQNLASYFQNVVLPRNGLQDLQIEQFTSAKELRKQVEEIQNQPYCFGVQVTQFDTVNDNYDFQLLYSIDQLPDSNKPQFNILQKTPDLNSWNLWFNYGSVRLQQELTEFVARSKKAEPEFKSVLPLFNQSLGFAPMSTQRFLDLPPQAVTQLNQFFPIFFMVIYWIPLYYLTSMLSSEKESKAREGMKMMGLKDSSYFLSWFILFSVISAITSIIATIVSSRGILTNVRPIMFFLFSQLYSVTLFGEAFFIVAFMPTKRSSGISVSLFHLISFFISRVLSDSSTSSALQYVLSLLPNVCMNQMIKIIFFYNFDTKAGLSLETSSISYQGYSYRGGMLMLILDFVLWGSLGLYLDQVVGSQFGQAKPWNFLCVSGRRSRKTAEIKKEFEDEEVGAKNKMNFETVGDNLKKQMKNKECLTIRGLVKKFGEKKAVAGVNLTMYNGQIFALLGHNGAGKTTTISMLTGFLEPDEGHAEVFGINIFEKMDEVRKMLGVCPQHDVLFDFLTPEDHLRLFAAFKGTPSDQIDEQVQRMLKEIDLYDQRSQLSKTLSGGQKRKLSVAIAMIGDSKIVILDEPTSGMDTSARRRLWDMLKKNKAGRIVILTTHYMDEADILGDRISIMAEGDVQCTGSSLFLKNRYGVGYNLVIAKRDREASPQIEKFVRDRIKGVVKLQEVSSEISFQLPKSSSDQFKRFFEDFDQNLLSLGIRSYGVGITTLEEVFLKIGHGEKETVKGEVPTDNNQGPQGSEDLGEEAEFDLRRDSVSNIFWLHLGALLRKDILIQIRDGKNLFVGIIFPVILIFCGLALATVNVIKDGKLTPLSLDIYPNTNNDTIGLVYNSQSEFLTQTQITDFLQNSFVAENKRLALIDSIDVDIVANFGKVSNHLQKFDEAIYNISNQNGIGPFYGQFYLNSLSTPKFPVYSGVLLLNSTSQGAVGIWGSQALQSILRQYLKDSNTLNPSGQLKLNFSYNPFPISKLFQGVNKSASGTYASILIAFAWMMVSDQLIQNIIRERQKNIKHQIMISGSSLAAYWFGHYLADIIFQTLPALAGIIGVHVFDLDVPKVEYLFLISIFSNPVFIYFLSFFFEKDDSGSLAAKLIYITFGAVGPIVISFLQVINPTTQDVAKVLKWFFYPFPVYSLTFGYMSISNKDILKFVYKSTTDLDSFDWNVGGYPLLFILLAIPIYWILVVMFERKLFNLSSYRSRHIAKCGPQNIDGSLAVGINYEHEEHAGVDGDILEEENRVKQCSVKTPIRVVNLKKSYGKVKAVKEVSFGLDNGECFALLGVSGAGKTSVFQCLSGNLVPDHGEVTISGHDVTAPSGFEKARKLIGYCPQFDAIFEGLTVYEHLSIYARLKGIPEDQRERMITKQIDDMDLTSYSNIFANNLSGGNKRKLSVAMALIGNPPLVFLDEPSTGVDPQAKRFMWNIVSKISTQRKKSSVILTTHSMEEAEALCTKMAIMVGGEFKCFGSSQHIKDKFGTGYEIEVKIRTLTEEEANAILASVSIKSDTITQQQAVSILSKQALLQPDQVLVNGGVGEEYYKILSGGIRVKALEFVRWQFAEGFGKKVVEHFKGLFQECEIIEHFGSSWKMKVSRDSYSIGYLFGLMEGLQNQFNISEYSVTQTTLEQIFNKFAQSEESKEQRQV